MMLRELIERLADKEHASWARWQEYLHSQCDTNILLPAANGGFHQVDMAGALVISPGLVDHWKDQITTPYAKLPEHSKESDRKEVREILPDIYEFGRQFLANGVEMSYLPPFAIDVWNEMFEEEGVRVW